MPSISGTRWLIDWRSLPRREMFSTSIETSSNIGSGSRSAPGSRRSRGRFHSRRATRTRSLVTPRPTPRKPTP